LRQMSNLVNELCTLCLTTAGRDKPLRLIQYAAKTLKWLLRDKVSKQQMETIGMVFSSVAQARNVMRFGREVPQFQTWLASLPKDGKWTSEMFFSSASKLAFFFYCFFDHFMYFTKVGIWRPSPRNKYIMNSLVEGSWFIECVMHVCHRIACLKNLADKKGALVEKTKAAHLRNLVRCAIDAPVALSLMDPAYVGNRESGHFGLMGTITSVMSVYENWPVSKGHSLGSKTA